GRAPSPHLQPGVASQGRTRSVSDPARRVDTSTRNGAVALERVADAQPRRVRRDELLHPRHAGALDVVAVAHVPAAVLTALGLLQARPPEQLLGLGVPTEV